MNSQIATEQPATSGKVILYTSHGEIDIELWTKQTPLACRNFIQHCMEGYYSNTIFHRLIPGFMIQGGDPTGTGTGGVSAKCHKHKPFNDEFHQRLKFTRRGIVAMANSGKNANGSQFFITFGACEHLNKKHTIFGKVVGDTIYNVMQLQSLDTGQNDLPLDPPVIRRSKVVLNPFSDLQPQKTKEQLLIEEKQKLERLNQLQQKHKKQEQAKIFKKAELKKLKKKNKLTFDIQQEAGLQQIDTSTGANNSNKHVRLRSSHDVLAGKDTSLSNKEALTKQDIERKRRQKELQQLKVKQVKQALKSKQQTQQQNDRNSYSTYDQIISKEMSKKLQQHDKISSKIKQEQVEYQRRFNPETKKYQILFSDELQREKERQQRQVELVKKAQTQAAITDQKLRKIRSQQKSQFQLLKADQLNFKKAKQGSLQQKRKSLIHEQKKLLSNLQRHRYEFSKKQKTQAYQGQLFDKLMGFTKRLKGIQTPVAANSAQQVVDTGSGSNLPAKNNSWMNHKLKFHIDSGNAFSLDQKKTLTGNNFSMEDDGGLKMEVDYYIEDQQAQQGNYLESLYKEVTKNKVLLSKQENSSLSKENKQSQDRPNQENKILDNIQEQEEGQQQAN